MAEIYFSGPFEGIQGSDLKSEDLTSQIQSGGTDTFTINTEFISSQCFVYLNGLYQGPPNGSDITIISTNTFSIATLVLPGDSITVIYSPLIKQQ
jgi:hypothetical protein